MISYRNCASIGILYLCDLAHELFDPRCSIEHRILGMDMEMDKIFGTHGWEM
jgi:hypothetical protein